MKSWESRLLSAPSECTTTASQQQTALIPMKATTSSGTSDCVGSAASEKERGMLGGEEEWRAW